MSHAAAQLHFLMRPLRSWLDDPRTQDIAIQRPGQGWIRHSGAWHQHAIDLSFEDLEEIAILAGAFSQQDVGFDNPILDTQLPGEERLFAALPPVVPPGTVALAIRKPEADVAPVSTIPARYTVNGWNKYSEATAARDWAELLDLYDAGDIVEFLKTGVRARLNIMIVGATGSSKTTLLKTIVAEIPLSERIITVEDALEIKLLQPNSVQLRFRRDDLNTEIIDSAILLQATKRMRPGRVILGEIRGKEAWTYANEVAPAHPGSVSTIHGHSVRSGLKRYFGLCRASPAAAGFDDETLRQFIADTVDVIAPLHEDRGRFRWSGVWFSGDAARRGQRLGDLLADE
jgi:type IV secretion system protein VirB11